MSNSQYVKTKDGWAQRVQGDVTVAEQSIAAPTDVQFVKNEPITWLSAKSVATGTWDTTAPYDNVKDYSKVEVKVKLGTSKPFSLDLYWSEDQTNVDLVENVIVSKTAQFDKVSVPVRGSFLKVAVKNEDAVANTFSVTGFKKPIGG